MKTARVELGSKSYDILIGSGVLQQLEQFSGRKIMLVIDSNVERIHGSVIRQSLKPDSSFVIPAGESSKTPEYPISVCRQAAGENFDRRSLFAAAGGGVTGDLCGFASAIFMRGTDFIQIPTTLLASVDSSVGGKTGADLPEGKNLVGAFHQPIGVFIDTEMLKSLPVREIRNGLAEIVKTAVIADAGLFELLENHAAYLVENPDFDSVYPEIIERCCTLKGKVVSEDEKESGLRAILNYGHTFGHALELLSNFAIAHGEAVSVGMAAAGELACQRGVWSRNDLLRQNRLLESLGLPVHLPGEFDVSDLISAMRRDKKNQNNAIRVVLCSAIGSALLPIAVPEEEIARAWEAIR